MACRGRTFPLSLRDNGGSGDFPEKDRQASAGDHDSIARVLRGAWLETRGWTVPVLHPVVRCHGGAYPAFAPVGMRLMASPANVVEAAISLARRFMRHRFAVHLGVRFPPSRRLDRRDHFGSRRSRLHVVASRRLGSRLCFAFPESYPFAMARAGSRGPSRGHEARRHPAAPEHSGSFGESLRLRGDCRAITLRVCLSLRRIRAL